MFWKKKQAAPPTAKVEALPKAKGGEVARTERYVSATGKLLNDREEAESRMAMDS